MVETNKILQASHSVVSQLEIAKENLEEILDNLPDGYGVFDISGRFFRTNYAFAKIFKTESLAPQSPSGSFWNLFSKEERLLLIAQLSSLSGQNSFAFESHLKNGSIKSIYSWTFRRFDFSEGVFEFLVRDVTLLRHAETSIEAAKEVQNQLIPQSKKLPGLEYSYLYIAAEEAAGDLFMIETHPDGIGTLCVIIDVTGHGLPAAMVTGVTFGAIKSTWEFMAASGAEVNLKALALSLHKTLLSSGYKSGLSLTAQFAYFNVEKKHVQILTAGHPAPLVKTKESTSSVPLSGNRLGSDDEFLVGFREVSFESGDSFVFYTDGLVENQDLENNTLRRTRLRHLVQEAASPKVFIDNLGKEISTLWKNCPITDDVTVLSVRVV